MKKLLLTGLVFSFLQLTAQDTAHHFFLVKTTGRLPFLEYGLGEDRLGGAKMGFLDSNIVLKIVDSSGAKYKVQLSKFHTAYVDKTNVERLIDKTPRPYYLTNSWKVYGDDKYD